MTVGIGKLCDLLWRSILSPAVQTVHRTLCTVKQTGLSVAPFTVCHFFLPWQCAYRVPRDGLPGNHLSLPHFSSIIRNPWMSSWHLVFLIWKRFQIKFGALRLICRKAVWVEHGYLPAIRFQMTQRLWFLNQNALAFGLLQTCGPHCEIALSKLREYICLQIFSAFCSFLDSLEIPQTKSWQSRRCKRENVCTLG